MMIVMGSFIGKDILKISMSPEESLGINEKKNYFGGIFLEH